MRQTLIAGNWKMNGSREGVDHLLKSIKARACEVKQADLVVFPPYLFIETAAEILTGSNVHWGAQNVCAEDDGTFTGEISASMLVDFGCQYVIVGHSERRTLYSETNAIVAAKCKMALDAGLQPIVCVGESLDERESDITIQVVSDQLDAVMTLADNHPSLSQMVIAYEPIWAIGTGKHATPEQAQEVHYAIRERCRTFDRTFADQIRLLYGGSVKPDNAAGLLSMVDIDGALIGGASLDADKFIEIGLLCNN